ncbi:MAG TPA: GtrA family protein [Stellaceae bacterium]|nr:GtrA family protein [Stellaceae bacterium]
MIRTRLAALLSSPFLRFLLSGGIAAAINIGARILVSRFIGYEAAVVVAYLIGMTAAYVLMLLFVFPASGKSRAHEYLRFGLVNLVALVQVWLVSVGLARWAFPALGFAWHPDTVAHVVGVLSPVVTSYAGHKFFTFAPAKVRGDAGSAAR